VKELLSAVANWISSTLTSQQTLAIIRAGILVLTGWVLARIVRFAIQKGFARTLTSQQRMLARRALSYTIFGLFLVSALRELGFDFAVLLGAAGIVTIAIGFASQTSASNLISGLFLVIERSIEVGDVIRIDGTTGEVLSIDLLSTKLRTFDNLLVRIPNESMVKTEITNLNRLPIRRFDLQIGVAYKEDLASVQEVLLAVSDKNPLCLEEPSPFIIAQGFGDSSINYQLSMWVKTENYLKLRNSIQDEIKAAFDDRGIEIPFPHLSLYSGSITEAFPIRIIGQTPPSDLSAETHPDRETLSIGEDVES